MRETLKRLWRSLCREHASPRLLAAGVAVGVLVGCSPFYGLHFWIGMGLALLLRLNKLAVLLGIQISIPPVTPVLIFAVVQTGALMLGGRPLTLAVQDLTLDNMPDLAGSIIVYWLAGWPVVGGALALLAFVLSLSALRRYHRRVKPGCEPS